MQQSHAPRKSRFATARDLLITYLALTVGALIGATSVIIFLVPFSIAPSGVSGIAVILNKTISTPIGIVVFILNIPIQLFGWYMLPRGWRTVVRTVYIVTVYTLALDFLAPYLPPSGITDNVLLNAIFGGVMGGIGSGIVIRAGGSFGGTSTLALIIQRRTGMPLSSIYLYTDALIIGAAGLVFGWEAALFAVVTLFMDGVAANYVIEGPSVVRTAVIVTNQPERVGAVILEKMERGATAWKGRGMYTDTERTIIYVTIARSQVRDLRQLVHSADPGAFVVIGQGHAAYGEGFKRLPRRIPL